MMTLELDDETGDLLKRLAEQEHIGLAQVVKKALVDYISPRKPEQTKPPELLTDFAGILADSPSFQGDPLEIQKAMRDEWG